MTSNGALRRFVVRSNGKVKIGSDVVITAKAPEHYPHVFNSDESNAMLVKMSPHELRERFAYWINDAGKGRNSLLCVIGPLAGKSKKFLQPVPLPYLRAFFDDVAFDWASFPPDHVPPIDEATGRPLFDPRFVTVAVERPTSADENVAAAASAAASAAAAAAAVEVTKADVPMPDADAASAEAALPGFLTKEDAPGKKAPPPAAPPRSSDPKPKAKSKSKSKSKPKDKGEAKAKAKIDASTKPPSKAKPKDKGEAKAKAKIDASTKPTSTPKAKAKANAKPKAKAKDNGVAKPKRASKAKAAASKIKWVDIKWVHIPIEISGVCPEEATEKTLVNDLSKCQLWFGNDMDAHPNLMGVLEEMTGMVSGIDTCALMCEHPL